MHPDFEPPQPPADSSSTGSGPEPEAPTPATAKRAERPHPLTPIIRGWVVLLAILIGLGRELIPDGTGAQSELSQLDFRWILLGVAAIIAAAAAAGVVTWYFTRFVIDDEELRIETGVLFKNSKRVPFERIQSVDVIQQFAARLLGLAELRIEVGSGDSTIRLRYLTRNQATGLRDYLLHRANGDPIGVAGANAGPSDLLTDLSSADKPLVVVPPQRLIVSFLLSSEFLVATAALLVAIALTIGIISNVGFEAAIAFAGLIPIAIAMVSLISRRLIMMFNFTVAESPRGLRITRGLLNLTSQSVPLDRIQGVRVIQPLLWRRLGWYRIDINVLGYGKGRGNDNDENATSVLLPVADGGQVAGILSRVLPGTNTAEVQMHDSPTRSAWLRPYDFWTLRYGTDATVLVTEHGWLTKVRNVIPHAKTQSVRLSQGPVQRMLRLADVQLDITRGPVKSIARQIDPVAARELTMSQLDRARAARANQQQGSARDTVLPGIMFRTPETDHSKDEALE